MSENFSRGTQNIKKTKQTIIKKIQLLIVFTKKEANYTFAI